MERWLPTYECHVWLIVLMWELIGSRLLNNINQPSTLSYNLRAVNKTWCKIRLDMLCIVCRTIFTILVHQNLNCIPRNLG